jgi:hypothetical protein
MRRELGLRRWVEISTVVGPGLRPMWLLAVGRLRMRGRGVSDGVREGSPRGLSVMSFEGGVQKCFNCGKGGVCVSLLGPAHSYTT